MTDLISRLRHEAMHTGYKPTKPWDLLVEAADEIERLRTELATESSRACATEHDCVWQPHCAVAGKCMRPERPYGAALEKP